MLSPQSPRRLPLEKVTNDKTALLSKEQTGGKEEGRCQNNEGSGGQAGEQGAGNDAHHRTESARACRYQGHGAEVIAPKTGGGWGNHQQGYDKKDADCLKTYDCYQYNQSHQQGVERSNRPPRRVRVGLVEAKQGKFLE